MMKVMMLQGCEVIQQPSISGKEKKEMKVRKIGKNGKSMDIDGMQSL